MTSDIKEMYGTRGYVIVPGLIPPELFTTLKEACERVVSKTRSGAWPYRRTVGRQFPPFDNEHQDSWGVQHIMHPDLGELIFAEWYTCAELTGVVRELLSCREDDLQMGKCMDLRPLQAGPLSAMVNMNLGSELLNMLINPLNNDFALRWHRDDVREDATTEEEEDALAAWTHGVCIYIFRLHLS